MGRSIPAVQQLGAPSHQYRLIMAKKKGLMTPERKKKLRTLLRKKAAEELKKEQERKAEERLRVIAERCGTKADLDAASMDDMKGKFIKPTLKKVSKYENKFAKLQEKAAKFAFANQLKQSKG